MKIFMQEYGRAILTAIIGSISIGICYFYLTNHLFFLEENKTELVNVTAGDEPVLIAPDIIKIDAGDVNFDAKAYAGQRSSEKYQEIYRRYLSMVNAYEDSSCESVCEQVTVAGIEQIDVTKPGRYRVVYRAENADGRSFSKAVAVIVR